MTKVTIHDTPSAQLVADAKAEVVATDSRGRKIVLRKPTVLEQFRIVKVVGGEIAANQVYMAMLMPLLFVRTIDGDDIAPPNSEREVDALIQRLDEDGIAAVALKVQEHWMGGPATSPEEAATKAAAKLTEAKDAIKK